MPARGTFIALLRGINLGSANRLAMKDLVLLFEKAGCVDVRTYIQSGNLVFCAPAALVKRLSEQIRADIERAFGMRVPVVLRTADELRAVARDNPFLAAGADEEKCYVMFLADRPDKKACAALDPQRSPPDAFVVKGREVYLFLPNGAARSKLSNGYFDSRLATVSTARNWRTVLKLVEMVEADGSMPEDGGKGRDQNQSGVLRAVKVRMEAEGRGEGDPGAQAPPPKRPPAGLLRYLPLGAPFELQVLGRALLHASLVGIGAGLIGAGFFAALEYLQRFALEDLAGYEPLRAYGEKFVGGEVPNYFRPWLLVFIPAIGALFGGLASRLAPETRGGGGDAMIDAFHHNGGVIRRRVIWVKALASIFTLGTGGSGGREGPTMQIGAALGSTVGRWLRVGTVERRVLMVAGVAAGISAVFRTPLGAALLAVEVLYRDDFEAEALVPAILASVIAYSVVISIYGESILFARAPRYPFVPTHLPLYGLLALLVALVASLFVKGLRTTQRLSARLPMPSWVRPAVGGLGLGVMTVAIIVLLGPWLHHEGRGLGLLGGGYGAAQAAIIGAEWLPPGWRAVEILLFLCGVKLVASCLTIGTGGSAGDFAPSLVLGALFGGAFGRAAQLIFKDPTIDPGAFALVGMGAFYGGVAHVPVSALILVSELAGSYDLLVPLMLAEGIAFVVLRNVSLYSSQVRTRRESPVHRSGAELERLMAVPVGEVVARDRPFLHFLRSTPMTEISARIADATWQDTFPVLDAAGKVCGMITWDSLRLFANAHEAEAFTVAADIAQPPVTIRLTDDLRAAAEAMLKNGLREVIVVDEAEQIVGFLDEADVSRAYVTAGTSHPPVAPPPPSPT